MKQQHADELKRRDLRDHELKQQHADELKRRDQQHSDELKRRDQLHSQELDRVQTNESALPRPSPEDETAATTTTLGGGSANKDQVTLYRLNFKEKRFEEFSGVYEGELVMARYTTDEALIVMPRTEENKSGAVIKIHSTKSHFRSKVDGSTICITFKGATSTEEPRIVCADKSESQVFRLEQSIPYGNQLLEWLQAAPPTNTNELALPRPATEDETMGDNGDKELQRIHDMSQIADAHVSTLHEDQPAAAMTVAPPATVAPSTTAAAASGTDAASATLGDESANESTLR